jgi:small GTP-binding protein
MLVLRAVVIGDARVGKTSVIKKYLKKYEFDPHEETTIGAMYDTLKIDRDGQAAELQIWDTAGQEQYRSLVSTYVRNAHAAALLFDVTSTESFESLSNWIETFRSTAGRDRPILIFGNKTDLPHRTVQWGTAADFASNHNCQYFETSALTGEGIEMAFESLIDTLISVALNERASASTTDQQSSPCCCC